MPASKVRGDYASLAQIAQGFGQEANNSRQSLQRITSKLDVLRSGDWTGTGADKFYQEMDSAVLPAQKRLIAALEEAQRTTQKIGQIIHRAEDDAAALFKAAMAGAALGAAAGAIGGAFGGDSGPGGAGGAGGSGGTGLAADAVLAQVGGSGPAQAKMTRDQAKRAAAAGAVGMNDAAAVLAGGAALFAGVGVLTSWTGIGGAVGLGGAVACGLGSAVAWYMGNRYQQLANDPPRDDYQVVLKFEPPSFNFNVPANDSEATWQDFTKQTMLLAVAMNALVRSLERYDGVRASREKSGDSVTGTKDLERYELAQIEAVTHNAAACAQLAESLVSLQPKVNQAWDQVKQEIRAASNTGAVQLTAEERRNKLAELWQSQVRPYANNLGLSAADIEEFRQVAEQKMREQDLPAELPDVLLDEPWGEAIQATSTQMRQLSHSYGRLKASLQKT